MKFVKVLAVVWLLVVAEAMVEKAAFGDVWIPMGDSESCDAMAQEVRDGESLDVAGAAGAYLQVALLQLAETGEREALLCARNVRLQPGAPHKITLRFHHLLGGQFTDRATMLQSHDRRRSLGPREHLAMRYANLPGGFRSTKVRLLLTVEHGGFRDQQHLLRLEDCRLVGGDVQFELSGDDGQLLDASAIVCADASPMLLFEPSLGIAALVRVSRVPVAHDQVVLRSFWRDACAELPPVAPSEGGWPGIATRDGRKDAARACIAWRSRTIAERLRQQHEDWLQQSDDGWACLLAARWGHPVESTFLVRPGKMAVGYGSTFLRRAAELQGDPADAALVASWQSRDQIGAWLMPILILLGAVAVAFYAPTVDTPPAKVGRASIVSLWLLFVVELGGVSGVAFAGVFFLMLTSRAPARHDRWLRVIAGLGLGACGIWCAQWLGAGAIAGPFAVFASMGRLLCWVVIAYWVALDRSLNARTLFVAFVVSVMATQSVGLLLYCGLAEDVILRWYIGGLAVASLLLLVVVCAGRARERGEHSLPIEPAIPAT